VVPRAARAHSPVGRGSRGAPRRQSESCNSPPATLGPCRLRGPTSTADTSAPERPCWQPRRSLRPRLDNSTSRTLSPGLHRLIHEVLLGSLAVRDGTSDSQACGQELQGDVWSSLDGLSNSAVHRLDKLRVQVPQRGPGPHKSQEQPCCQIMTQSKKDKRLNQGKKKSNKTRISATAAAAKRISELRNSERLRRRRRRESPCIWRIEQHG
jgi:hypothetical protein